MSTENDLGRDCGLNRRRMLVNVALKLKERYFAEAPTMCDSYGFES
jgi:hypothetical protein